MSPSSINDGCIAQSLTDALYGIGSIVNHATGHLEDNRDDIFADAVWFEAVINSICLSWHRRWMIPSLIDRISQIEFEVLCRSVPQWDHRFEIAALIPPSSIGRQPAKEQVDPSIAMLQQLHDVKATTERLVQRARRGALITKFDVESTPMYRDIVIGLCRAWYYRHRFPDIVFETQAAIRIPDWGLSVPLRVVSVDWRLDPGAIKRGLDSM